MNDFIEPAFLPKAKDGMEELRRRVDNLTDEVAGFRKDMHEVRENLHQLDKQQAVLVTNFTVMSQNVATLTTSVATLAVTINKQSGAVAVLRGLWALVGAGIAWVAAHWKWN